MNKDKVIMNLEQIKRKNIKTLKELNEYCLEYSYNVEFISIKKDICIFKLIKVAINR